MAVLIRYELKKLLTRKVVWIALALCAALQLLYYYGNVRLALGGAAGGMKEIYLKYDGQAVTETLKGRMLADYREYAAAHPEEFKPSIYHDSGYWAQDEQIWQRRHGYGVMLAYQMLLSSQPREEIESAWQRAADELASGVDSGGKPLSASKRSWNTQLTAQPPVVPVVRYNLGWSMGGNSQGLVDDMMQRVGVPTVGFTPLGILLTLLLLLIGLPGFHGERIARMEPVLLTGAQRKSATFTKLIAAITVIAITALALCLLDLLLRFVTLGLDGWRLPSSTYGLGASHLAAWAVKTLAFMLGSAAGVVLITAVTALACDGISALSLAAAALAAQFGLWNLGQWIHLSRPHDSWSAVIHAATSALPLNVVSSEGFPYGILSTSVEIATLITIPLALCITCLLSTPACYLRRRKA